ncbi:DUF664 domain-containing protein [Amycolatopsis thailandensis]|uniref:mycothiol transferase n=1 Tax=Amycolatopsis thailandensis TaxID=589330 RepID=UPI003647872A
MAETPEPPPGLTDTRALLVGYLDHNAAAILRKLGGLSEADLRRSTVPSGWTPLGMVKHLACTQRLWIRYLFAGEDVDFSWPGTAEQEWLVTPDETIEEILEFVGWERQSFARHAGHVDVSRELLDGVTGK